MMEIALADFLTFTSVQLTIEYDALLSGGVKINTWSLTWRSCRGGGILLLDNSQSGVERDIVIIILNTSGTFTLPVLSNYVYIW